MPIKYSREPLNIWKKNIFVIFQSKMYKIDVKDVSAP